MREASFFKDTPRKTLDMDGQPIEFPMLYYDLRCITSIFTANMGKFRKLLPHPNLKPIKMWPGKGLLGITAFEYRDLNDAQKCLPSLYTSSASDYRDCGQSWCLFLELP